MSSFKSFSGTWFGYTRKERRATFILLIIILVVISVRFIVPSAKMNIEVIPVNLQNEKIIQEEQATTDSLGTEVKFKNTGKKLHLTDLNRCDSAELVALPGIGPVLSGRIIKFRKLLGGFVSVGQLKEVYGLPPETFDLISSRVFADSLTVSKIDINSAEYKDIIRHPYFRKEEVSAILKYRRDSGMIKDSEELKTNNLISDETYRKIRGYLRFE